MAEEKEQGDFLPGAYPPPNHVLYAVILKFYRIQKDKKEVNFYDYL